MDWVHLPDRKCIKRTWAFSHNDETRGEISVVKLIPSARIIALTGRTLALDLVVGSS